MAFPPLFLERVKNAHSLPELIGVRLRLRRSGREWVGCCPFHQEKSPSFRVYDDHYHCYGCGAHGDAVEFLKTYENLNYREAVEKLASEAGIPVPESSPEAARAEMRAKTLYGALDEACRFFEAELQGARGAQARQYLEKRGIRPEMARQFRLGYAPDARDALKRHLLGKGFSEAQALEAGLLVSPDQGSAYDRFRDRLIFAICDATGRVIAFGGRILRTPPPASGRQPPKYLNSPETPLFKKGETVYNLHQAGKPARESVRIVLVEGYMDVVACAQAGLAAAVAPLGTAVTAEQLRRLWQVADAPILCLDGDAAGMRASLRAAELALPLLTPGKTLKFALLPKGEDPDSMIAQFGLKRFEESLTHARELHDLLWTAISGQHTSADPTARAALEKRLKDIAEKIADPTLRNHSKAFFREKMWAQRPGSMKKPPEKNTTLLPDMSAARQMFKLILAQPLLIGDDATEERLMQLECASEPLERLRNALMEAIHAGLAPEDLKHSLEERGFAHLIASLMKENTELLPKNIHSSLPKARGWLEQLAQAHHLSLLEAEYAEVQERLGHSTPAESEILLPRLMALQNELRDRKAERLQAYLSYGEES